MCYNVVNDVDRDSGIFGPARFVPKIRVFLQLGGF